MQGAIATIAKVQREEGIAGTSLLNYCVSDGRTLVATRYVSNDKDSPASLYYAGEMVGAQGGRTVKPFGPCLWRNGWAH